MKNIVSNIFYQLCKTKFQHVKNKTPNNIIYVKMQQQQPQKDKKSLDINKEQETKINSRED